MAVKCFFPNIGIPAKAMTTPATAGDIKLGNHDVKLQVDIAASSPLKKFCIVDKVFEKKDHGVVCYRDENGELICEAYDEGPRFTFHGEQQSSSSSHHMSIDYVPSLSNECSKVGTHDMQKFPPSGFLN